jgi:hypothetical protein
LLWTQYRAKIKSFTHLIPESERAAWMDHVRSLLAHPRLEAHTQQVTKPDGNAAWLLRKTYTNSGNVMLT